MASLLSLLGNTRSLSPTSPAYMMVRLSFILDFPRPADLCAFYRVGIDNVATYSTVFYQVERRCLNQYVPPPAACSQDVQQGWANVDVYEGRNYNLATFNYNFPVKLTVVDAGYRTEKVSVHLLTFSTYISSASTLILCVQQYYIIMDGVQIGQTHDYQSNWGIWCGITADQAQNCLNQAMSSGVFVIPAGSHSVAFSSLSTRNPAWSAYSTLFYKIEKYCP